MLDLLSRLARLPPWPPSTEQVTGLAVISVLLAYLGFWGLVDWLRDRRADREFREASHRCLRCGGRVLNGAEGRHQLHCPGQPLSQKSYRWKGGGHAEG